MKLYDYFRSSASYRVRIALAWKNIPYTIETIHLIHEGGAQHTSEYIALNPQALVPSLVDDEHVFTQSLAIIEYLDEKYPIPPLLPKDLKAKAEVRSLAQSIACDIHPLNNLRVLQQLRQQFSATEEAIQTWYHLWIKKGFTALEARLQKIPRTQAFCYGDSVSLADLCLIPQVYNAKRFHCPLTDYPMINVITEHCTSLDAFIRAAPKENHNA